MSRGLVPSGAKVEDTDFTLEGRVLCGDDSCIGTIGPDKRCKVCGRPYEGDVEIASGAPAPATSGADDDARPDGPVTATAQDPPRGEASVERTCCPDDACIGIIGPSGACGICGKSHPKAG